MLNWNRCLVKALVVDIELLFGNLIDNALKYAGTPPEVKIRLTLSEDKSTVFATVSDNGMGIPRNMRRRVYARFFRIGNELERTKPGTGLGLFFVKTVVRRLRGSIAIDDSIESTDVLFRSSCPRILRGFSTNQPVTRIRGSEASLVR